MSIRWQVLVTVVLMTGACAPTTTAQSSPNPTATVAAVPVDVRFGVDSFAGAVVVYVAREKGFFENEGIRAKIDTYATGADSLNAVLAGMEDFGYAFDFGSVGAMASNQLRYVAAITRAQPGFHKLAMRDDVQGPADLIGKKIGVVFGTTQHFVTVRFLQAQGIPLDKVEMLSFGTPLELVAALRTGQISSAWVFGPAIAEAEKSPRVRLTIDDRVVVTRSTGYLIATRTLVETRADIARRVFTGLLRARNWTNLSSANRNEAMEIVAKDLKVPVASVKATLDLTDFVVNFDETDLATLGTMASFRESLGGARPIGDMRQYLALDPLRQVDPTAVSVR